MANANINVSSSESYDEYTSLANAEAGTAVDGAAGASPIVDVLGRCGRWIVVTADSTIKVKQPDGATKTLTMVANVVEVIQFIAVVASGSTLGVGGRIKVYR